MGAYLLDWVALFFRWFHVIAGVAWIGASFYFVWLDMSLRKPPQWRRTRVYPVTYGRYMAAAFMK